MSVLHAPRIPATLPRSAEGPRTITWPLALICLGFPLLWMMGLSVLILMMMAIPMAVHLRNRGRIMVPRGFGIWMMFLALIAISALTLYADAPTAQHGGSPTRILSWALFSSYYVAATVVFLWVGNADERELPTLTVIRLVGFLYVVAIVLGMVGWKFPTWDFPSLMELPLPQGLRENVVVKDLLHPAISQEMTISQGGAPVYRTAAPFSYTNAWGCNTALLAPFFVYGYIVRANTRMRIFAGIFLVLSVIPIITSLNRGMWIGLILMAGLATLRLTILGRFAAILVVALGFGVVGLAFVATPLGAQVAERLANGHSDSRRGDLASYTLESAMASPIVGFGSTRPVQGNFVSVAGADPSVCPQCAVPPLGTHGHLYRVAFSQGFLGALLYFGFIIYRIVVHTPSRDPVVLVAWIISIVSLLFSFYYNLLPHALYIIMIALALAWRRDRALALREATVIQRSPVAKETALPAAGT